jgi:hypothetical protein
MSIDAHPQARRNHCNQAQRSSKQHGNRLLSLPTLLRSSPRSSCLRTRAVMAMKIAMSASECDGLQRVFDRNVRSYLAIGYTPTNHDSDFLGAARAYYKDPPIRVSFRVLGVLCRLFFGFAFCGSQKPARGGLMAGGPGGAGGRSTCLACRLRSPFPDLQLCFRFLGLCTTIRLALEISWMSGACSTTPKAACCSLAGSSRSLAATTPIGALTVSFAMMPPPPPPLIDIA